MKTTRSILASSILIMAAAAGAAAPASSPVSDGWGSVTITVRHSLTKQPLPMMPVTVLPVIKPEGKPFVYKTGRDGSITINTLVEGTYDTFVNYNNQSSEVVRFELIGDYHALVTLFFNPDIDTN